MTTRSLPLPKLGYRSVTVLFLLIAALALALSDIAVSALNPWAEMRRLVSGLDALNSGTTPREVTVTADDTTFTARVRIDTPKEADYYRHGGILQYVLRQLRG